LSSKTASSNFKSPPDQGRHQLLGIAQQLIKQGLEALPPKFSQLRKLEDKIAMAENKISTEERKLDARRKILLGAFLMAQVKHRPEQFDWIPKELEKFLDTHTSEKIAASNKEVLADWLKS
jgi:hypothetical protein